MISQSASTPALQRFAVGALCVFFGAIGATPAAEAVGLDASAGIIEHTLSPGQVIQGTMDLANTEDTPVHVSVYLEDWTYTEDGSGQKNFAPAGTTPRSSATWISYSPTQIDLAPHARTTVDYTIRVPQDASLSGGYYAVLFSESILPTPKTLQPGDVFIESSARIGTLFLLGIRNTVHYQARLANLAVSASSSGGLVIDGVLDNESNVIARCEDGSFHVQSSDGLIAARGQLPPRFAWMRQEVPLHAESSGRVPPGGYSVILTYDCGDELFISEEAPLTVR